jgi:NitT/TauT family transport system permease protein
MTAAMIRRFVYPAFTLIGVVVVWQGLVDLLDLKPFILPAPTAVFKAGVENASLLLHHSLATIGATLAGFALSVVVGVPLAILIVSSRTLEGIIYPLVISSQMVPKVAIAPLFVVWFGFGSTPKVLIAFLIAFFPVVISSVVGLESPDRDLLQMLRSMGASKLDMFRKVRIPHALPSIFAGFKIAMTLSVIGAIVGEFVASNSGVGYLLLVATGSMNTALLFAGIVVLTIIGVLLFEMMELLEKVVSPWHIRTRADDMKMEAV